MKFSLPTCTRKSTSLFSTSKEHLGTSSPSLFCPASACVNARCNRSSVQEARDPRSCGPVWRTADVMERWRWNDASQEIWALLLRCDTGGCDTSSTSSSPLASQELQGVTTSTTSQPFHQTFYLHRILKKHMLSNENDTWPLESRRGQSATCPVCTLCLCSQINSSIHRLCFSRSCSDLTSEWCVALFIKHKIGSKVGARRGTQTE